MKSLRQRMASGLEGHRQCVATSEVGAVAVGPEYTYQLAEDTGVFRLGDGVVAANAQLDPGGKALLQFQLDREGRILAIVVMEASLRLPPKWMVPGALDAARVVHDANQDVLVIELEDGAATVGHVFAEVELEVAGEVLAILLYERGDVLIGIMIPNASRRLTLEAGGRDSAS